MAVYVAIASEFLYRWHVDKPFQTKKPLPLGVYQVPEGEKRVLPKKILYMVCGLGFATLCIFIR